MENGKQALWSVLKFFLLYILIATLGIPLLIYLLAFAAQSYVFGNETSLDVIMDNSLISEVTLILGNLCIIVLFLRKGYTNLHLSEKPWKTIAQEKEVYIWAVLLELFMLLPLNVLIALLNWSDYSTVVSSDDQLGILGILGACFIVPLAEELVMRGGIEEKLLQWKNKAALAIPVSAFLFAILHVYPSLMLNAFVAGLVTGWVYYRTRNVLVCFFMHMTCNAVSCLLDWIQPGHSISEFAQETHIIFLNVFCMVFMVLAFRKLKKITAPQC